MHLTRRIEKFLEASGMSAARFGREAARDPRLVFDLRQGRSLRPETAERLKQFLQQREAVLGGRP